MNLVPLAIASLVIAFFLGSESLFYLAYALIGILLFSRLWTQQSLAALHVQREEFTVPFTANMWSSSWRSSTGLPSRPMAAPPREPSDRTACPEF